ncbi:MAG: GtrA family protein [Lachnospiraceae bacterium]|nr:GtrA family protein [Lachnospiraceae bacterium]
MIKSLYNNSVIRYIFFGGLTTLVNLVVYYILRTAFDMNLVIANFISVATSIIFAYFVNSRFVFCSMAENFHQRFQEFVKFVSARLSTMVIEIGGVWFLAEVLHMNDMIGKFIIQFVVLALNYLFSKFLVFTKNGAKE